MTKIISDGKDKTFYAKCYECATDFEYQLSDVEIIKECDDIKAGLAHLISEKAVKCPSCGEYVDATLMTKEEQDKYFGNYFYRNNCGVC